MKKILMVANWKSNPSSQKEAEVLFRASGKIKKQKNLQQVICAPAIFLPLGKKYKKNSFVLGSQDVSAFPPGAHTGDISGNVFADAGIVYSIVGHSERRALGETNNIVADKIFNCFSNGIVPIICIGESKRDEGHAYLAVIRDQLLASIAGSPKSRLKEAVIAYEPLWAIGDGAIREATPEEFREVSVYMRKVLSDACGNEVAKSISIIYGGSADEKSVADFVAQGGAQGFLVGRASLVPKRWEKMITNIKNILK